MALTKRLQTLSLSARRLNDGSDELNKLIAQIDEVLHRLRISMDFIHPRPLQEHTTTSAHHKRTIELSYLAYLRVDDGHHLVVKTVKIMEDKAAVANESPGSVTPLLHAPRHLRHAAVDVLPELVDALSSQIGDLVSQMERRCETARELLDELNALEASLSGTRPVPEGLEGGGEDSGVRSR